MKLTQVPSLLTVLETKSRLHKELSYLISLHENKMNKGKLESRISELENKLNEMSHALSMVYDRVEPIEDTNSLFATPTPEPTDQKRNITSYEGFNSYGDTITSTTLKTPNEWLKLMSEEEVKLWEGNMVLSDWKLDMNQLMTFETFIKNSFGWVYWQNISNRYNN